MRRLLATTVLCLSSGCLMAAPDLLGYTKGGPKAKFNSNKQRGTMVIEIGTDFVGHLSETRDADGNLTGLDVTVDSNVSRVDLAEAIKGQAATPAQEAQIRARSEDFKTMAGVFGQAFNMIGPIVAQRQQQQTATQPNNDELKVMLKEIARQVVEESLTTHGLPPAQPH